MPPRGDGGALTADLEARRRAVELIGCAAALLFANGQTTERTVQAVERLGRALGVSVTLLPRWDVLTLEIGEGVQSRSLSLASAPTGVDMGKVAIVLALIEQLCDGRLGAEAAAAALDQVKHAPPTSTIRFAIMAAAGAMALGVIFGAVHLLSLALIGISAGLGGWLRRALGRFSRNPFLQPFSAALLAGLLGAATAQLQLSSLQRLIAVCPCMVLVPGPHLLNGAIDLVRARIALGAARMAYAGLIILAISAGLLGGLALGGVALPAAGASHAAPLVSDVIAAGVAVAAYGTFFSMPWRMLPIPVLIGMLAHALRWTLMTLGGASPELGALVACLLVGTLATPIADRLRLPFAGFAFASVVSLIPGVFLFRMAGGVVELVSLGAAARPELALATVADGATALLILLAMAVGLLAPKMAMERLLPDPAAQDR